MDPVERKDAMDPEEFDDDIDIEDEEWEDETFELGVDETEVQSITRDIVLEH